MPALTIFKEFRDRYKLNNIVPTEYPNEPFTRPVPPALWARFNVLEGDENALDIGSTTKSFRTVGLLSIQLFAPSDKGSVDILTQADTIADIFRNWNGDTVTCREAKINKIGNTEDGWYQVNVTVPFKTDYIK